MGTLAFLELHRGSRRTFLERSRSSDLLCGRPHIHARARTPRARARAHLEAERARRRRVADLEAVCAEWAAHFGPRADGRGRLDDAQGALGLEARDARVRLRAMRARARTPPPPNAQPQTSRSPGREPQARSPAPPPKHRRRAAQKDGLRPLDGRRRTVSARATPADAAAAEAAFAEELANRPSLNFPAAQAQKKARALRR
mmetsp:Transcript_18010/g.62191  ORF Transcript_18010/g.62191 Transcript_18010/m.62191 type:complete len:201 (-) Transcript_18010:54-656(-)